MKIRKPAGRSGPGCQIFEMPLGQLSGDVQYIV